jgi:hypothetical protein
LADKVDREHCACISVCVFRKKVRQPVTCIHLPLISGRAWWGEHLHSLEVRKYLRHLVRNRFRRRPKPGGHRIRAPPLRGHDTGRWPRAIRVVVSAATEKAVRKFD